MFMNVLYIPGFSKICFRLVKLQSMLNFLMFREERCFVIDKKR
jgi:hypothetical protein